MKPVLVIGLGNPLMGDDGVGCQVAESLASDPRLPPGVEAVCGGTDLLRCANLMEGRERAIVLDAIDDGAPPGTVADIDCEAGGPDTQEHAHHLSAVQSVRLLRMTVTPRVRLLGISVVSAGLSTALSPAIQSCMPQIVDRVLEELKWNSST
jgi:hydrogenase maturation protease